MAAFKNGGNSNVQKSIRSKMIQRVRRTMGDLTNEVEKNIPHLLEIESTARVQSNMRGKVRNRRTGPKGRMARVSDGAVDSIAADMEKRTRRAIEIIGRSRGF